MQNYSQHLKYFLTTVSYLKLIQVFYRILRKFHKTKNLNPHTMQPCYVNNLIFGIEKSSKAFTPPDTFTFLNHTEAMANAWDKPNLSKLWLYNLHYFDYLHTKSSMGLTQQLQSLMTRWIAENQPGTKHAWDPYPTSLRIVNWIKWLLATSIQDPQIITSIAMQARFLAKNLEYHLLGNHILANAKALIFAGCFFFKEPDGKQLLHQGLKLLSQQLEEQILPDGGHFELSPMYHAIILEDLLDIINLLEAYKSIIKDQNNYMQSSKQDRIYKHIGKTIDITFSTFIPLWKSYSIKMLSWLKAMTHPDGEIVFFNDSAKHIAAKFDDLLAYATRLKLKNLIDTRQNIYLEYSGYIKLVKNDVVLLIDAANIGPDYIPGHAHADNLSFELSISQQRIIVNSGTSSYENNALRAMQRGTCAHNTVTVDHQNSSEVWHAFRVAKRAKITARNVNLKEYTVKASHNGYQKIIGDNILHERTWTLKERSLHIKDYVSGAGYHILSVYFHFHPNVKFAAIHKNQVTFTELNSNLGIKLIFDQALEVSVINSSYYPEFGLEFPNKTIKLSGNFKLPISFNNILVWEHSV